MHRMQAKKLRFYEEQEKQQIKDLENTGKFGPNEKEYIKKDGTRYPIIISGFSFTNNDNKKVVWGIIEDITEKKQYEIIYNDNKFLLEYIAIETSLEKVLDKKSVFGPSKVKEFLTEETQFSEFEIAKIMEFIRLFCVTKNN